MILKPFAEPNTLEKQNKSIMTNCLLKLMIAL